MEVKDCKERGRVTAHGGELGADQRERIRGGRLGEFFRPSGAFGQRVPTDDLLNDRERFLTAVSGVKQSFTEARMGSHQRGDGRAGGERGRVVPVLRCPEQPADDPVVQFDDLIGNGRHALNRHREQGRVAPARLELRKVSARHRCALTSQFQQTVTVHKPRCRPRQIQCLPRSEAFDMLEHGARVRAGRGLPQPTDLRQRALPAAAQQPIQPRPMCGVERVAECRVDPAVRPGQRLRACSFDHINARECDSFAPQGRDRRLDEDPSPIGLDGNGLGLCHDVPVVADSERGQPEIRAGLACVFLTGLLPDAVVGPRGRGQLQVRRDLCDDRIRQESIGAQSDPGPAQQGQLEGEPQLVRISAMLPDQRHVSLVDRAEQRDLCRSLRQPQDLGALGRGQQCTARHLRILSIARPGSGRSWAGSP